MADSFSDYVRCPREDCFNRVYCEAKIKPVGRRYLCEDLYIYIPKSEVRE